MDKPLVSVAMVVYNNERFLVEAIESILKQTFHDFEFIIVVDLGSTDRSESIVSHYQAKDSRIKSRLIPHCSLPEARNSSCFLAKGRYIALMDADDVAFKDRLTRQVEFMESHAQVGVLGGAMELIDATGRSFSTLDYPLDDRDLRAALFRENPFAQPTVVIRREAFVSVGGYRKVFARAEDYDLWLRVAAGGRWQLANLEAVVLRYRIHPSQGTQQNLTQEVIHMLAARAAASSNRTNDGSDPLSSVREITSEVLTGLGVSEATLQQAIVSYYLGQINLMCRVRQDSAALRLALDLLRFSRLHIERRLIADTWLRTAGLYWRREQFFRSLAAVGHAVRVRPAVAGRPAKQLLRRLGRTFSVAKRLHVTGGN
jgi:glycosyltransferase involved in cell wall biosynthesis